MNAGQETPSAVTIRPPQLTQSLVGGFNAVANNIWLILLPVAVDLLLWFGPHLRLQKLLLPGLESMIELMQRTAAPEMRPAVENAESVWKLFLEQYNFFNLLSTFPVGVPSLMTGIAPANTPLGLPDQVEVSSYGQMVLGWLALNLLGLLIGSIYFAWVAKSISAIPAELDCDSASAASGRSPSLRPGVIVWQMAQALLLVIILVAIVVIMMVPSIFLSSILALVSPILAQFTLIIISLSVMWFLIPLVFSPHGIFLCGQSAFNALFTSRRVVGYSFPNTMLFLAAAFVLLQGLGVLWRTPPANSWMALVGIFGHAFISTGLLAASFFFYRAGLAYVQSIRKLRSGI